MISVLNYKPSTLLIDTRGLTAIAIKSVIFHYLNKIGLVHLHEGFQFSQVLFYTNCESSIEIGNSAINLQLRKLERIIIHIVI